MANYDYRWPGLKTKYHEIVLEFNNKLTLLNLFSSSIN